jgi:hypothetical protein
VSVSTAAYLLELDVWNGSGIETWRLGTHTKTTASGDTPASAIYRSRLVDAGQMDRQLSLKGGVFGSPTNSPVTFEVGNVDGYFDSWLNPDNAVALDGRAFRFMQLNALDLPVAGAAPLILGTVRGVDGSNALKSLKILASDRLADLNQPLLRARYAGTTLAAGPTAEGDADLADQIKPYIGGSAFHVLPKFVNKFNLLYQVSVARVASIAVFDGGLPLTLTGDFPDIAALIGAPLVAGQYATCLVLGLFRLGIAAKAVSASVVEGASVSDRSAARVVQRMLALYGVAGSDIDAATFDAFHAFKPAEVGIAVSDEATAADTVARVTGSVLGAVLPTEAGKFAAVWLSEPASLPAGDTYSLRDIGTDSSFSYLLGADDGNAGIPAWRVVCNWGKIWNVFSGGDILGAVDAATRALLTTPSGVRQASAEDASVRTAHPLAVELTVDTLLVNQAEAEAEAALRLNLFKRKRGKIVMPLPFDLGGMRSGKPAIGSIVKVKDPLRPMLAAGRNYFVLGRKDDFTKRRSYSTLWG